MIFGYLFFIILSKIVIEKILGITLNTIQPTINISLIIIIIFTSYFSLTSFLNIYCYNLICFRRRFELICGAILKAEKSSSISAISKLNLRLNESLETFNGIFPLPLEFFVSFSIFSLAFSFYEIYFAIIIKAENKHQLGMCILSNSWNLFMGMTVLAIFNFGSSLKNMNERILHSLLKQFQAIENVKIRKRILIFIMQINHVKPQVYNGFYVIDWKLLLQVNFYM